MNISINEKKKEAISRMKSMKIYKEIIDQFEKGIICESECPFGACYWINEDQKDRIKKFEEEYDALVYHVIHSYTDFGEMESYLYVSDHKDEWDMDNEDIKSNFVMAYVYNKTEPEFSEIGSIMFKVGPAGGLLRVH